MSEIHVIQRTQRIDVIQPSGRVVVESAGPIGPAGPAGELTLEQVRDDLVTTLVAGSNVIITHDDLNDTITISSTGGETGTGGGYTYITPESAPPASPEDGDTWYATDTGATYLRLTGAWVQTASTLVNIPYSPTFHGNTVVDGDLVVNRTGLTSRIYIASDDASYLAFSDSLFDTWAYIDVIPSGVFVIRNAAGEAFFSYNPVTGAVTFPDGGVPASDITLADTGSLFDATNVEAALAEVKAIADAGVSVLIDGGNAATIF